MSYADLISGVTETLLFEEKMEVSLNLAEREGWHGAMLYVDVAAAAAAENAVDTKAAKSEEALTVVRAGLKQETRACDLLVKNEKDHFLVWLQHVNAEHAMRIGERLQKRLSEDPRLTQAGTGVKTRIGIALYPYDGKDIGVLSQRAFYAVHQSRARKRAVHIYDPIAVSGDNN